ncbi:MAG: MotA/TolQ/ExbB proton channel family protein [Candidatus Aureabacteria bacterium]|nr:MotA/TolQ/ExbB proton channel family protein [Candidatus Auribacterota bacterium]
MQNVLLTSFLESGPFGKFILIILAVLSIYAWSIVQNKFFFFKKIRKENKLFLKKIKGKRGNILNIELNEQLFLNSPLFNVFNNCTESLRESIMIKDRIDEGDIEALEIVIQKVISQERIKMEDSNFVLATIASISPFLGLLGTVWGIMKSFRNMGMMGSASITAVAPGLSEALITTVAGLIVAIPAVVVYNYTINCIKEEMVEINNFSLELLDKIEKLRLMQSDNE